MIEIDPASYPQHGDVVRSWIKYLFVQPLTAGTVLLNGGEHRPWSVRVETTEAFLNHRLSAKVAV
jgi:hypothetical protein